MKSEWRSVGIGGVLILLLTVGAYIPALRGGFVWDDDAYVIQNQTLRSEAGLRQIWVQPEATSQYYPLTFSVFWAEYHGWELKPFGYHLVNVLLQAVNAVLFWRLLARLKVPGAWWAAAVFALHPVHVMSVAWVTELKNVLSGLFYLGALMVYLRFSGVDERGPTSAAGRRGLYGLALALYLCALLSKTATSLLPVAIVLILWWKRGRLGWKEWVAVLPFFVVGIGFGAFTLWLEKYVKGAYGQEFTLPFLERLQLAGRSFWFCLGKLVWPARLTFVYPSWPTGAQDVWAYVYPLGAVAVVVGLWRGRRWLGRAPVAALVYFTLAFPALVLVQVLYMMRYTPVADHWQYLGSMSVIPLGVGGAVLGLKRWGPDDRRIGFMIGAVVLAVLGWLTWRQGAIYRDVETLWRDTLAKNPDAWLAHNNLGLVLSESGRREEAIDHWQEALRIRPDYAEAHINLGAILWQTGHTLEAIEHWREAVRISPRSPRALNNLGVALSRTDRIEEAIRCYERALRIEPDYPEAHYNLGNALEQTGQFKGAIEHYEETLRLRPDSPGLSNRIARLRVLQ
jgi:protein O-mannosyl-transferase